MANPSPRRNGLRRRVALLAGLLALAIGSLNPLRGLQSVAIPVPLNTAASVLSLTSEQAKHGPTTQLQGVVTLRNGVGLVIQDSTAGIWINFPQSGQFTLGDEVEVHGKVGPGQYSPEIWATSAKKIGHRALPPPKHVSFRQLSSGDEDAQYVTVEGVVRSIQLPINTNPRARTWFKLAMKDGIVDVALRDTSGLATGLLLDAEVRINAVALSSKNRDRQLTSVVLDMADLSQMTVLKPTDEDPFSKPLVPVGALMQYRSGTNSYHRVRVAGVVTYYDPGKRLILQDGEKAILVMTDPVIPIELGDRIEVSGFPALEASGPFLEDAVLRFTSHGSPPLPTKTQVADILSGASRYRLVTVQGHIVRSVEEPWGVELLVQGNTGLLPVELQKSPKSSEVLNLREGTEVGVTGIGMVDVEGRWDYTPSWLHCKLLLRSVNDLEVLELPSWWTTSHVVYLAGLLILVLVCLVMYNQIARWKLQVVLRERERMARDVHDSMAQSFAGIGFQLQAIVKAIPEGMPILSQEVALARELVRHSHKEARQSFAPTDPDACQEIDLLSSLETSAHQMIDGGAIAITVSSIGSPRTAVQSAGSPNIHTSSVFANSSTLGQSSVSARTGGVPSD
ncbi:sensor histidine kinase [Granulicella arctica]|uniref:Signal transduction histidine kinase subgroup 3 dimerisation and phosphoacceptor domain-containing protein n=1 Tax=Granulicella arctica TaxID=940613 RepID=A0A7Y9TM82_9BACT|nr:histidine kinase dimerization/phosphoacceptor domain-containing protein [Granulicella arctica]NYF80877.1 hypothetical protein [Granulicella arctica]